MANRFVSIWFRHLSTDWFTIRQPHLKTLPFVLQAPSHGRMIVTAANALAEMSDVSSGMVVADARAVIPNLEVMDDKPDLIEKLLTRLAEWCIRFTPLTAIDPPDGLLLDATGCAHLWGGEKCYVDTIVKKLNSRGYDVREAMADTAGVAWGVARFGKESYIIQSGQHIEVLLPLPPEALRLERETVERLHKLGLHQVKQFIYISRSSLRRRFGSQLLIRLDRALGKEVEMIDPVQPLQLYQERLPSMEPIVTARGIEIALKELLEKLCDRLQKDQKGLRNAIFRCYRVDGKEIRIEIGTNRPSHNYNHLFKLFEIKLPGIEPSFGIELFILEAPNVEDHFPRQEKMWGGSEGLKDSRLSELIDRLSGRHQGIGIYRYLPNEHYWPERSFIFSHSLEEKISTRWRVDKQRPLKLLLTPERIEVTAPIPDYPPMLFRYKGKLHTVIKADGPERIEQEWWLQKGQHRDYYCAEDQEGKRYWLFRLGHYDDKNDQWFIHGFFP
jgi:protein ImuB